MLNNCRGVWSVHKPDYIVMRVMNLLKRKELLIIDKESLPVLTCGPSQKFSTSSEPYEFLFFSENLNFSQLVRFHSPSTVFTIRLTNLSLITMSRATCLMETLGFL
ncbi:uncharacterized protein TNCV_428411 [Trichonephila clavipes]|nr:uncharacterized protein TNCV_428411 [Trichonephila clavipes]